MTPKPRRIRLGDKSWTIRAFTLTDLRDLDPIARRDPSAAGENDIDRLAQIVFAGVKRDDPTFGLVEFNSLSTTFTELNTAARHVLEMAGYVDEKAETAGEARAAEAAAETGSTSDSSTGA